MKVRNLILVGAALIVTYKTGELMGHIMCKRELARKRADDICEDGRIIEIAGKRFKVTIFESGHGKKAEGEAQ